MMPLTVAGVGVASTIKKIGGKEETRKKWQKLIFTILNGSIWFSPETIMPEYTRMKEI